MFHPVELNLGTYGLAVKYSKSKLFSNELVGGTLNLV